MVLYGLSPKGIEAITSDESLFFPCREPEPSTSGASSSSYLK